MASKGDPRVLFVMNLVLSSLFAAFVVWGLAFVDVLTPFSWQNAATLALLLMALTYVVTR